MSHKILQISNEIVLEIGMTPGFHDQENINFRHVRFVLRLRKTNTKERREMFHGFNLSSNWSRSCDKKLSNSLTRDLVP